MHILRPFANIVTTFAVAPEESIIYQRTSPTKVIAKLYQFTRDRFLSGSEFCDVFQAAESTGNLDQIIWLYRNTSLFKNPVVLRIVYRYRDLSYRAYPHLHVLRWFAMHNKITMEVQNHDTVPEEYINHAKWVVKFYKKIGISMNLFYWDFSQYEYAKI